jgi:adenosylcobinamide-phosphate synthase
VKILIWTLFSLPALAFVLDLFLGDPMSLPHPVRLIGRWLDWLEPRARGFKMSLRASGALCVAVTAGLSAGAVYFLMDLKFIGVLFMVYFAYAGLALGELLDSARDVVEMLEEGSLEEARESVGQLVSRTTTYMGEAEIRRTLAETVSENLCDGFVAPLFYLVLGGPALMWGYKAVSTMDSMWGYKTEEYREFGWASARSDDILAYIPARLTAFLLIGVGALMNLNWREARLRFRADALKMESPNAGWPMAACAWLLEGTMGGAAVYFGTAKDKPYLGPIDQEWTLDKLKKMFRLILFTGIACVLLFQAAKMSTTMLLGLAGV